MKNIFCLLALAVLVSGCVSVSNPPPPSVRITPALPEEPFAEIVPGMDYQAVAALLQEEVATGYEADPVTGEFKPVYSRTLVSSEIVQADGEDYQVDLYLPQGESVPVPFIFSNGVLSAKGTAALAALRARAAADHAK